MKPQRERRDGFGLGRLGGISSSIRAHGKVGLLPVSDDNAGWCIKIRDKHFNNAISLMFPDIPKEWITMCLCWCRHSLSLFNICATIWVDLWFVADYRRDESSN